MNKHIAGIVFGATIVVSLVVNPVLAEDKEKGSIKVFILAGQSNKEGHAAVSTFDYIGKDPLTAPILKEMRNADGTSRVCDKVWMSYWTGPYGPRMVNKDLKWSREWTMQYL
jgi:hypothetical protein